MRRITVIMLTALGLLSLPAPGSEASEPAPPGAPLVGVHAEDGRFADSEGRTVILRGANVLDKWTTIGDPDLVPDMEEADYDRLAAMGFNVVRLGTSWKAVEPERGVYDDAFLDQMRSILDELRERRIFAVVDMHQDVWSEAIGSNGAPEWADPQCNVPPRVPWSATTGQWYAQYFSPDSQAAFSNFWNDGYGDADLHCTGPIQTDFVNMWGHVADRLGNHPAVIGYDLLNEPWPGLPPGAFEQLQLFPFYERVAAAIRAEDPDGIIFFEPPIWKSAMLPSVALAPPDPNSAFAPHLYTETMYSEGQVSTAGVTDEVVLLGDLEEADRLGVPAWIGEWGAFENDAAADYRRQVYDLFDRHQVGSAYWMYTQGSGGGIQQGGETAEAGHVRVYPEAFPGEATWSYDPDARTFTMTIAVGPGTHTARVVVPDRLSIDTDVPGAVYDEQSQRLRWTVEGPGTFTLALAP